MAGNISERVRQLFDAKVDRRAVLRGGALGLLGTVAAACGKGGFLDTGLGATPSASPADKTPNPSGSAAAASPSASGPEASASAKPSTSPAVSPSASPAATPAKTDSAAATAAARATGEGAKRPNDEDKGPVKEAFRVPKENGKYRTFDRSEVVINGQRATVLLQPDSGSLGPDHDTIFGVDLEGDIDTEGIEVISSPGAGNITETRVVGIRRTDLPYVQFKDILEGDAFDELAAKPFGGDEGLNARARHHAANSGHTHQKVVYLGDLGLFQKQFGETPRIKTFLNRLIRAQVPPRLGIPESNFVVPKT